MTNQVKEQEQNKKWGKLISQCWADEAFKQRFISDPGAIMKEAGLDVPAGVELKVVEDKNSIVDTDTIKYILLPPKPGKLTDEQLDAVAGGGIDWNCVSAIIPHQACNGCFACY